MVRFKKRLIFSSHLTTYHNISIMPRDNFNGFVKIHKQNEYVYYLASITLLRKNHRKYFKYTDEGKALAESWLSDMRVKHL